MAKERQTRERMDYVVIAVSKDGTITQYDCGPSIRGANQVCKALKDFAMKQLAAEPKIGSRPHQKTASGGIPSVDDLLAENQ